MMRYRKSMTILLCALLALVICALPVVAETEFWSGETESWRSALQYAGCALGIAAAPTGLGIAVAVAACLILMTE